MLWASRGLLSSRGEPDHFADGVPSVLRDNINYGKHPLDGLLMESVASTELTELGETLEEKLAA